LNKLNPIFETVTTVPEVSLKDFGEYIAMMEGPYGRFLASKKSGEDVQHLQVDTASLSTVPDVYFEENFSMAHPEIAGLCKKKKKKKKKKKFTQKKKN
jgi:hypothetical protein